ncbi:DNA-dependent RNA polymerase subunit epsilon [Alteribacillus sp. HJP-4]|uniref:DNA-dependent RNA polymerase subunit epsilon n=1 Tax=Alteribacillus sp. HJP-4 TaxID=2775394 RepID=UPI0035CCD4B9
MIYKVFYQKNFMEVPVRENTDSILIEADSEKEVRRHLADKKYNIEFIQQVSDEQLAFEKQSEDFKLEKK